MDHLIPTTFLSSTMTNTTGVLATIGPILELLLGIIFALFILTAITNFINPVDDDDE